MKILDNKRKPYIHSMKFFFYTFVELCQIQNFSDIVEYRTEKLKFLYRFADFEHGITSYDNLSTVFRALALTL